MSESGGVRALAPNAGFGVVLHYGRFMAVSLIGLLLKIYMTRNMAVGDYGHYVNLIATISLGAMIFSLGLANLPFRYIPEMLSNQSFGAIRRYVIQWNLIQLAIGAGLLIIFWPARDSWVRWIDLEYFSTDFFWVIVLTFLMMAADLNTHVLNGFSAHILRNGSEIVYYALKLALVYAALASGHGVIGVLMALVASTAAWNLLLAGGVIRKLQTLPRQAAEALSMKRMARYAGLAYLRRLDAVVFDTSIDIKMINSMMNSASAGLYELGSSVAIMFSFLNPLPKAAQAILPFLIRIHSESGGNPARLQAVTRSYYKIMFFSGLPVLTVGLMLADPLISTFFDKSYAGAAQIFLIGVFCYSLSYMLRDPLTLLLQVYEKMEVFLYQKVLLIYNISMNYVLISAIGAHGAMISTGSSLFLGTAFEWWFVRKQMKIEMPWAEIGRMCVNCLPVALFLYATRGWISGIPSFVLVSVSGYLLFYVAAFFNRVFTDDERAVFEKALGRFGKILKF